MISTAISSVQLLSHVWLCDPMDCRTPGFPGLHYLLEFSTAMLLSILKFKKKPYGRDLFIDKERETFESLSNLSKVTHPANGRGNRFVWFQSSMLLMTMLYCLTMTTQAIALINFLQRKSGWIETEIGRRQMKFSSVLCWGAELNGDLDGYIIINCLWSYSSIFISFISFSQLNLTRIA